MTPTIVFDFDGTLATGNGPILSYARQVAAHAGSEFFVRAQDELREFDSGNSLFRDGYDVVGSLARQAGVPAAALESAYDHSRAQLGSSNAPVTPAAGLHELLLQLDPRINLELATNAPATGIDPILRAWGVRERFTQLHFTVGKPAGLVPIVTTAKKRGPVLAVGDIYEFDLAPAAKSGADTALVGVTAATQTATTTLRGNTLADLVPGITTWANRALTTTSNFH